MITSKNIPILLMMLCIQPAASAQQSFPRDYFRAPVDIPMYLSGNFGELRSNHFHAGIDIKTQGVIGHKVHASAEGYISRIKIEAAGYGNTLYITHPAGYTTVYGHLDRFREDISEYVGSLQYKKQQHAINIYPEKEEWPVAKGDFIAFSGTSGYSFGPHLHFEIRDAARQAPMNVLLFGFDIKDDIPPRIFSLYIYPKGNTGLANNSRDKIRVEVEGGHGKFQIQGNDTLRLNGSIGFGIEAYDYLNGASNRCGLYSLQMMVDDVLKFHWKMDKFLFSETRYVNSYIDYGEKGRNKITIQKTYVDPNNKLGLYNGVEQSGILDFSEKRIYHVSFLLQDSYGNRSELNLLAEGGSQNNPGEPQEENKVSAEFLCLETNEFKTEGLELKIPTGALYEDLGFIYERSDMLPGTFSPLHHLHDPYTPLHMDCELSIEPTGIADSLQDKALLGFINGDEENVSSRGEWVDGRVVGNIKEFGRYTVMIDTIPPSIRPLKVEADMSEQTSVRFLVTDELSGIKSYEGYIDNEWALFEYDLKNDLVYYTFDASRIKQGSQHELELYIIDNKDNISYYYTEFYW